VSRSLSGNGKLLTMGESKRTMLVLAHTGRENALSSARQAINQLTSAGVAVRVTEEEAAALACSVAEVLPALAACAAPDADFALMVKPQFEMGKGKVGAGGVVRLPADRAAAVRSVCATAWALGLGVRGVTASPLPGPAGNVEYFVWLSRGAPPLDDAELSHAIESGPQ